MMRQTGSNDVSVTRRTVALLASLVVVGVVVARPWNALSAAVQSPIAAAAPLTASENPAQALQKYREESKSGDVASSIEALRIAADGGQPLAEWKLGTMYRAGDGVPRDDAKAYGYFARIVSSFDEDASDWREDSLVSSAFVAMGQYSLTGLPAANVPVDPGRAAEMFQYAATRFGDADAQYDLARMYLDGSGVARDPEQAARWLNLAADKGHKNAQAVLGDLLFKGASPLQPQRAMGLMYLTLAREAAADPKADAWIVNLQDAAVAAATEKEKDAARRFLEAFVSRAAGSVTAQR